MKTKGTFTSLSVMLPRIFKNTLSEKTCAVVIISLKYLADFPQPI